ncbi:MAG: rod shape-determining protein MreC [Rickettsiales bacterium]|nr:rod shape-determining protein MreC [Rickettsiales bacterium]
MKQYVKLEKPARTISFSKSLSLIFTKIETLLFSFLCIILIISSKINPGLTNNISFFFIDVSLPIVRTASAPFNFAANLSQNLKELSNAKQENEILKSEISKLKKIQIQSINISQENTELKKILNFAYSKTTHIKTTKIVGRTNEIFNRKLYINAGANQDIKAGSIVTGDNGVIGRIAEISDNKSRLVLINDATSRIPVIASNSRTRAILAGNGSNIMELLYLPKNHEIKVGELIFTSGDGDTLPPGLLTGVVTKVTEESVLISPAQNNQNTDIVLIVEY